MYGTCFDIFHDSKNYNTGSSISSIDLQPFGHRLATSSQDNCIKLWNITFLYHAIGDQAMLAHITRQYPSLTLESLLNQRLLCTLTNHTKPINCVRWNKSGTLLASCSDDAQVLVWKYEGYSDLDKNNKEIWRAWKILTGHRGDVMDLAWSADSIHIASCGMDTQVIIWDVNSGQSIVILNGHEGIQNGIVWDPFGRYIAVQSNENGLAIWKTDFLNAEAVEGSCFAANVIEPYETEGNSQIHRKISWSPDGQYILTTHGISGGLPTAPLIQRNSWTVQLSVTGTDTPFSVAV